MLFAVKEKSFITIRWTSYLSLHPWRITTMPQGNYKTTNWALLSRYSKVNDFADLSGQYGTFRSSSECLCLGIFANSVIYTCIEHMYRIFPYYFNSIIKNTSPNKSKRIVPKFHFVRARVI
ncbi:hypothetical protein AMTRI_Chr11g96200 [Amborella trichopoda]